jgi:hypothetical protein
MPTTGLTVGNLMVCAIGAPFFITPPTGWTIGPAAAVAGTTGAVQLFWKPYQAGDPTTATFTFQGGNSTAAGTVTDAYSGVDLVTPFATPVIQYVNPAALSLPVGSMTSTVAGSLALIAGEINSSSTTFTAYPTGYTQLGEVAGKRTSIMAVARPTAGTVSGSLSYTYSASQQAASVHVEMLPAVSFVPSQPRMVTQVARNRAATF